MSDVNSKKDEDKSFIREKKKKKPVNWIRLARKCGLAAIMGCVFAVVFAFVNVVMTPVFQNLTATEDEASESAFAFPEDQEETGDAETEDGEATSEEEAQPDVVIETQELEVADYQSLQSKLYAIGKEANKSIVTVISISSDTDIFDTDYESSNQETGLIIGDSDDSMLILTEYKEVAEAETIQVAYEDGTNVEASMVNYDANTGLAVLSVPLSEIPSDTLEEAAPATLGDADSVTQGQVVIAAGSPLGSVYSILAGTITAVDNEISLEDAVYTMFTTDMLGSTSGSGVLLNLDGEVIGIMLMDNNSESDQNTLTAISVTELKSVIEKLSNGKDVAYLGAKVSTVTEDMGDEYDIPTGVYVKSVTADGPAYIGGLQTGDVIVAMNNTDIEDVEDYMDYLEDKTSGDTVNVKVMRLGNGEYKEVTCEVTLTKK